MKKILCICLLICGFYAVTSAARLFNADFSEIQESLDELNAELGLNMDMVLLSAGDTCAGETNFGRCSTQEYTDSGDLLFVVDITQRRMESMLREGLSDYVLPKQETLTFEQQLRVNLQEEEYEEALKKYIDLTEDYLEARCDDLGLSTCRIDILDQALQEQEREEAEASAGRVNTLTRSAVRAVVLLTLFISIIRGIKEYRKVIKNRNLIRDLKKNTDFVMMQIKHDNNIFDDDKKKLKKKLKLFKQTLEDLQSQSAAIIEKRLESMDYIAMLQAMQTEYKEMVLTIAKTDDIEKKKKKIKKKNL